MKKWIAVLLALVLAVSLSACSFLEGIDWEEVFATTSENEVVPTDWSETTAEEETTEATEAPTAPPTVATASTTEAPTTKSSAPTKATTTKATTTTKVTTQATTTAPTETKLKESGYYYSKDDVALYIHQYGKLPGNFLTKAEAEKLGWTGGSLEKYAPGKCIGGSRFGNYEGLLPQKKGRTYTECDIDTKGKSSRGAKRIVFSNDGLIYYTDDHYETFTLLYGEP